MLLSFASVRKPEALEVEEESGDELEDDKESYWVFEHET
jgi:hypothetical protein